ncbi:MAG: hypothetical protein J6K52_07940 [Clostridia bacterium]|nr:hypothetical protein [Clostridia bacterium]
MTNYNLYINDSIKLTQKKQISDYILEILGDLFIIFLIVVSIFIHKVLISEKIYGEKFYVVFSLYIIIPYFFLHSIIDKIDYKKYCFTLSNKGINLTNFKGKYFIPYEEVKSSGLLHEVKYGVKYTYYISVIYFSTEQLTDKELKKRMRDTAAINGSRRSTKKLIYISLPKEEAIELHKTMQNWLKNNVSDNILK